MTENGGATPGRENWCQGDYSESGSLQEGSSRVLLSACPARENQLGTIKVSSFLTRPKKGHPTRASSSEKTKAPFDEVSWARTRLSGGLSILKESYAL